MMSEKQSAHDTYITTKLQVLDTTLKLRCRAEEEETLRKAAIMLDGKMRRIRDKQQINNSEKIALLAALDISCEFTQYRDQQTQMVEQANKTVTRLEHKIIHALTQQQQIEL
jgi:cell division protein ZapA